MGQVPVLLGRYFSPYVRRVAISFHVLGIPFEHRVMSATRQQAEVRRINPVGRLPALILEDGEVLVDSAAILDHIDNQVGPDRALMPPRDPERRRAMYATVVMLGAIEKFAATLYERMGRPPEKVHQPWIDRCLAQSRSALDALETLAGPGWLVPPKMTQADITAAVGIEFIRANGDESGALESYPRLLALADRCNALPAFRQTTPND